MNYPIYPNCPKPCGRRSPPFNKKCFLGNRCETIKKIQNLVRMPASSITFNKAALNVAGGNIYSMPNDRKITTKKKGVAKKHNSYDRYLLRLQGAIIKERMVKDMGSGVCYTDCCEDSACTCTCDDYLNPASAITVTKDASGFKLNTLGYNEGNFCKKYAYIFILDSPSEINMKISFSKNGPWVPGAFIIETPGITGGGAIIELNCTGHSKLYIHGPSMPNDDNYNKGFTIC